MNNGRKSAEIPQRIKSLDSTLSRQYTVSDGLAGMQVEDIYQDRRGLLWIATADGGVSRFDGTHFDTFSLADGLPHPTVMTIAEDADGRLWFGTLGGGLAAFDGRGFQVYTTEHGLPSNEIVGLQPQADGSIRVLTSAGFGLFAAGQCIESTTALAGQPIGRVYDMTTDSAGTTWLATRDRGVISLEGRHLVPDFGDENGALQWAWKFAQDASGHLWIAFHRKSKASIGRYDPSRQRLDLIDMGAELAGMQIAPYGARHVRIDDKGWLWVARPRNVLMHDGQDWHSFYEHMPGIDPGNTRLTYEDREGNIWVGLWDAGLVFCDLFGRQLYTEADGLPDRTVRCLEEDGAGRLWIGTMGGLACLEDDRIRSMEMGPEVWSLEVDCQETLWIGSTEGKVFKGTTAPQIIAVTEEDNYESIRGLCQDQTGRLWVGTSQGTLGWIEEDRFIALEGQLPHRLKTMTQDSEGVLWIGAGGEMPALYYKDRNRLRASDLTGLEAVSYVNALCEHAGTLWVGTNNGLFAVDLHSKQVRQFTKDQGRLTSNNILSLAVDQQGRLWIGTRDAGVIRYDGETFHGIRLGPSMQENMVEAILCDHRGRLWFGTRAGLIAYEPCHTPPGIAIRQVVQGRLLEAPQAVSYPEDIPEIAIHFQGIRFRIEGAEQMHYSHRLIGHGPAEEWSEFRSDNKVSYHGLPVGKYRFEVRAQDQDKLVSEVAHLEVSIDSDAKSTRPQRPQYKKYKQQTSIQAVSNDLSPTLVRLLSQVEPVAKTSMTMLLQGETGSGKSLFAQEIHALSPRRAHAFVTLNCGALPTGLAASELFGHERGAFTGAMVQRKGFFEQAHGGTLFLDEIGDLAIEIQQVLLHILEGGPLRRIGSERSILMDVRVIAATNRNMKKEVEKGRFRADLFHRLSEFTVEVPPLRDLWEDISILVAHFVRRYAQELKRPVPSVGNGVMAHLQAYSWPGNVRELSSLIRRAVVLCRGRVIEVADVPLPTDDEDAGLSVLPSAAAPPVERAAGAAAEDMDEKQRIIEALKATKGRVYGARGAARLLGMHPERLRSRMRVHGLQRPKKAS